MSADLRLNPTFIGPNPDKLPLKLYCFKLHVPINSDSATATRYLAAPLKVWNPCSSR
jgi:hypothetical protein